MANDCKSFYEYISTILPCANVVDFSEKKKLTNQHVMYMFDRTQSMFKWSGLPETIPARILELYLQINGNACFAKHGDELFVYTGGMGGEPDVYYRPTIYTVANPAQKFSKNFKIGVDCVVMPNDSLYMGLLPLYSRYATMITETELSINIMTINNRDMKTYLANDDNVRDAVVDYLDKLKDGKQGAIVSNNRLYEMLRVVTAGDSKINSMQGLIELLQYARASWFNDIGLNANYNMKRESLNTTESQMNNDALLPLVDDMLSMRQEYAEKVNEMFGTEISVDLASSWKDNEEEINLEHESMDADSDKNENTDEIGGENDELSSNDQ